MYTSVIVLLVHLHVGPLAEELSCWRQGFREANGAHGAAVHKIVD